MRKETLTNTWDFVVTRETSLLTTIPRAVTDGMFLGSLSAAGKTLITGEPITAAVLLPLGVGLISGIVSSIQRMDVEITGT